MLVGVGLANRFGDAEARSTSSSTPRRSTSCRTPCSPSRWRRRPSRGSPSTRRTGDRAALRRPGLGEHPRRAARRRRRCRRARGGRARRGGGVRGDRREPRPGAVAAMAPTLALLAPGLLGFALVFHAVPGALRARARPGRGDRGGQRWLDGRRGVPVAVRVLSPPGGDGPATLVGLAVGSTVGHVGRRGGSCSWPSRRAAGHGALAGVARTCWSASSVRCGWSARARGRRSGCAGRLAVGRRGRSPVLVAGAARCCGRRGSVAVLRGRPGGGRSARGSSVATPGRHVMTAGRQRWPTARAAGAGVECGRRRAARRPGRRRRRTARGGTCGWPGPRRSRDLDRGGHRRPPRRPGDQRPTRPGRPRRAVRAAARASRRCRRRARARSASRCLTVLAARTAPASARPSSSRCTTCRWAAAAVRGTAAALERVVAPGRRRRPRASPATSSARAAARGARRTAERALVPGPAPAGGAGRERARRGARARRRGTALLVTVARLAPQKGLRPAVRRRRAAP